VDLVTEKLGPFHEECVKTIGVLEGEIKTIEGTYE